MFLNASKSKAWHTSSASSQAYFDAELSRDYYAGKTGSAPCGFAGEGARALGLLDQSGSVTKEQFSRLADGLHPGTGEKMTMRLKEGRRTGIDVTCSAPKTVSIMARVDSRVIDAHDAACAKAREVLLSRASVRDRAGDRWDSTDSKVTGGAICAHFRHLESRNLDPSLHTHNYLFNLCRDTDGTWKALESRELMQTSALATKIYRRELAAGLEALGYQVSMEVSGNKGARAPEIVGVSPALRELFSSRSKEIYRQFGNLSPEDRIREAQANRPEKIKDMTAEKSLVIQKDRAVKAGLGADYESLNDHRDKSLSRASELVQPVLRVERTAAACVEQAKEIAFERASTVTEIRLAELAMETGLASPEDARVFGGVSYEDIRKAIEEDPTLIRANGIVTTESLCAEEYFLRRFVETTKGKFEPVNPGYECQLEGEQGEAVKFALSSKDLVLEVQGKAGTGKSFTLQTVVKGIRDGIEAGAKDSGREVIMVAPWSGAVESLRNDKHEAATLASFLLSKDEPAAGSVIICDEAGLVGVGDMMKLLQKAARNDCRVILLGDTMQHAPVVRGDALRVLENSGHLAKQELKVIRRQTEDRYRQVVEHLSQGEGATGALLADRYGFIQADEDQNKLFQAAAVRYVDAVKSARAALEDGDKSDHSVGLVCPVWAEINDVQGRVRALLREEGILTGEERHFTSYQSESFLTEAERKDPANCAAFQEGRVIQVTNNIDSLDLKRGDAFTVTGSRTDQSKPMLLVETATGRRMEISARGLAKAGSSWMPAVQREIAVCSGDKLLLRANGTGEKTPSPLSESAPAPETKKGRPVRFINGEVVQVQGFDDKGGIVLTDGRTIPSTYKNFQHGYALTSHLSQGKTYETALVVMGRAGLQASNREQFYVSCSRGRQHLGIFTSDKNDLIAAVAKSGARQTATEIRRAAREKATLLPPTTRETRENAPRHKARAVVPPGKMVSPADRTALDVLQDAGTKFVQQVQRVSSALWKTWEKGLESITGLRLQDSISQLAILRHFPSYDVRSPRARNPGFMRAAELPESKEFQARHAEQLEAGRKMHEAVGKKETPAPAEEMTNRERLLAVEAKHLGRGRDEIVR